MNDAFKSQISAFVDGELPDNETELLLRRLCQDAKLRAQAAHYLTIGRAMRGELDVTTASRLRGRILAALGEEVVAVEPVQELVPTRFMRPVVGVAVAATVAVAALLGLQRVGPIDELSAAVGNDLAALAIDGAPSYTEPPADAFVSDRPSDRMARYYQHHNARAADIESRLVSLELRQVLELREGELVPVGAAGDVDAESNADDTPINSAPSRQ